MTNGKQEVWVLRHKDTGCLWNCRRGSARAEQNAWPNLTAAKKIFILKEGVRLTDQDTWVPINLLEEDKKSIPGQHGMISGEYG